ncbi:hypothetical protein [Pseudomonas frederiksbergensis]|uniref:hypothetical protein n=1 Tax=Pseudomonas frederiksbergensis TaxID=104087 RepID=UPI0016101A31|nr:hypothetical protein [Pseudomonas frederiksbergensis]
MGFFPIGQGIEASLERQFDKERSNVTGDDGAIAVEKRTDYFPEKGTYLFFTAVPFSQ